MLTLYFVLSAAAALLIIAAMILAFKSPAAPPIPGTVCPTCHAKIHPMDYYCIACGARLKDNFFCVHCGAPLTKSDYYCAYCSQAVN